MMNLLSLLCSYLPGYQFRAIEGLDNSSGECISSDPQQHISYACYSNPDPVKQLRRQIWRFRRHQETRRFLGLDATLQHQLSPSDAVGVREDEETIILAAVEDPGWTSGSLYDTEPIQCHPIPYLERLNRIKREERCKNKEIKRGILFYANDCEKQPTKSRDGQPLALETRS
jgi:hypothetical protein